MKSGGPLTRIKGPALGDRPTVGHMALDHGIGVRIPVSQPTSGNHNRKGCLGATAHVMVVASRTLKLHS